MLFINTLHVFKIPLETFFFFFPQDLAPFSGNINEFKKTEEYVGRVRRDVRSKQFKLVILQNPVEFYGTTPHVYGSGVPGSAANRALLFHFPSK